MKSITENGANSYIVGIHSTRNREIRNNINQLVKFLCGREKSIKIPNIKIVYNKK